MRLHYFKTKRGNFGDDLNTWIWDWLLPGWRNASPDVWLIGIGTLLNENQLGSLRENRILVLGSGVGYGHGPPRQPYPASWDFRAVRGPLSANALSLPNQIGIIDPATLIPEIPEFHDIRLDGPPLFIPHHVSVTRHDWELYCEKAGLSYVSPEDDSKKVIKRIASAPLVVTEAMHGAIIADAFAVPWVPVQIGDQFNIRKWNDWLASLELSIKIPPMFPFLYSLKDRLLPRKGQRIQQQLFRKFERQFLVKALKDQSSRTPILSCRRTLELKKTRLRDVLSQVIKDYTIDYPNK